MKKIFGKGGVIDKETRRWDKQADEVTRNIDASTANTIGMEGGAKPSHLLNDESIHHKEAVKFFKGQETSAPSTTNAEVDGNTLGAGKEGEAIAPTTIAASIAQASNSESSAATDAKERVAATALVDNTENKSQDQEVALKNPSPFEITTKSQDDKPEINEGKIMVWAKTLLEHKELTNVDKKGLPHFIKTGEEVDCLTNKIFELASIEGDSSYITIASELVAQITDLYSGSDLS